MSMKYKSDIQHIKSVAVRFGNLHMQSRKTEEMHKQIVRLGSALRFVQEWYDLHNQNRQYNQVWRECEEVLKTYDIKPKMIGKIIVDSENCLTYREGRMTKAKETAVQLSSFVNPYMYDEEGFIKEMTQKTHPTLQQSVGSLLFHLISEWGDVGKSKKSSDPRNSQLRRKCKLISDFMSDTYGEDWYKLTVI